MKQFFTCYIKPLLHKAFLLAMCDAIQKCNKQYVASCTKIKICTSYFEFINSGPWIVEAENNNLCAILLSWLIINNIKDHGNRWHRNVLIFTSRLWDYKLRTTVRHTLCLQNWHILAYVIWYSKIVQKSQGLTDLSHLTIT